MTAVRGTTVYIIDDDASVRRGLRRLLRTAGYEVEEFESAKEFLEQEPSPGVGCLVLDVRMPHMTGPELFDRMARVGCSLPVVFLTGHGDVSTSVHVMKGGAVDFLLKPVDAGALLRAIEAAMARHAAAQADAHERAALETRLTRLSLREREVMEHVVRGEPNKLIAAVLGISEKTVKVHRQRVMAKMEAASLPDLVRLALSTSPRAGGDAPPSGARRE